MTFVRGAISLSAESMCTAMPRSEHSRMPANQIEACDTATRRHRRASRSAHSATAEQSLSEEPHSHVNSPRVANSIHIPNPRHPTPNFPPFLTRSIPSDTHDISTRSSLHASSFHPVTSPPVHLHSHVCAGGYPSCSETTSSQTSLLSRSLCPSTAPRIFPGVYTALFFPV